VQQEQLNSITFAFHCYCSRDLYFVLNSQRDWLMLPATKTKLVIYAVLCICLLTILKNLTVSAPLTYWAEKDEKFLLPQKIQVQSLPNLRDVSNELRSIVFLHIPKCGGSTVNDRIKSVFPRKWKLTDLQEQEDKPARNRNYYVHTYVGSEDPWPPNRLSKELTQEERNRIRLLTGHLAYGACQLLAQPCRYITVLREPRARLLSEVKWIQKVDKSLSNLTTSEFITEAVMDGSITRHFCPLLDNHETRVLSGDWYGNMFLEGPRQTITPCGFLRNEHAQLSIDRLADGSFQAVGTMEKLDSFFSRLNKMFAADFGFTGKALNVNKAHGKDDDITPEAEEIIQSMIKYDVMIYEAAKKLWNA
jgi:hypothetical protein